MGGTVGGMKKEWYWEIAGLALFVFIIVMFESGGGYWSVMVPVWIYGYIRKRAGRAIID